MILVENLDTEAMRTAGRQVERAGGDAESVRTRAMETARKQIEKVHDRRLWEARFRLIHGAEDLVVEATIEEAAVTAALVGVLGMDVFWRFDRDVQSAAWSARVALDLQAVDWAAGEVTFGPARADLDKIVEVFSRHGYDGPTIRARLSERLLDPAWRSSYERFRYVHTYHEDDGSTTLWGSDDRPLDQIYV